MSSISFTPEPRSTSSQLIDHKTATTNAPFSCPSEDRYRKWKYRSSKSLSNKDKPISGFLNQTDLQSSQKKNLSLSIHLRGRILFQRFRSEEKSIYIPQRSFLCLLSVVWRRLFDFPSVSDRQEHNKRPPDEDQARPGGGGVKTLASIVSSPGWLFIECSVWRFLKWSSVVLLLFFLSSDHHHQHYTINNNSWEERSALLQQNRRSLSHWTRHALEGKVNRQTEDGEEIEEVEEKLLSPGS